MAVTLRAGIFAKGEIPRRFSWASSSRNIPGAVRASGPRRGQGPLCLENARMAYKPDSVQGLRLWMTIPLPTLLPRGSSCQPGPLGRWYPCGRYPKACAPDQTPHEAPIWHCSGWGLPCRSCYQSRGGLLPHRFTFTTLCERRTCPRVVEVSSLWRFPWGCPRRGLPGTLTFWSPDFPRTLRPAVIQPSARGRGYACAAPASTEKRRARSAINAASVSSSGPSAQGRNRKRNAVSTASAPTSG